LTIADCRLAIGGLTIVDCRSTGCRLAIGIMSIANAAVINPSIVKLAIANPSIVKSAIANPSIGNRQSAPGN